MGSNAEQRSYLSIREVLDLLVEEFPDITISKIRFLESRGLIHPERTPSGYRKFFDPDVERLRWILRQQRENFLPLKVIKGRLDGDAPAPSGAVAEQLFPSSSMEQVNNRFDASAHEHLSVGGSEHRRSSQSTVAVVDRATETVVESVTVTRETEERVERAVSTRPTEVPAVDFEPPVQETSVNEVSQVDVAAEPEPAAPAKAARQFEALSPRPALRSDKTASFTVEELAKISGADIPLIVELQEFGLIEQHSVAGVVCFDDIAVEIVRCAVQFARFGLEPRHLNAMHHAAEREAGLYATVVTPLVRQRNPEARERASRDLEELTVLGGAWREAFLRAELRHLTGG